MQDIIDHLNQTSALDVKLLDEKSVSFDLYNSHYVITEGPDGRFTLTKNGARFYSYYDRDGIKEYFK